MIVLRSARLDRQSKLHCELYKLIDASALSALYCTPKFPYIFGVQYFYNVLIHSKRKKHNMNYIISKYSRVEYFRTIVRCPWNVDKYMSFICCVQVYFYVFPNSLEQNVMVLVVFKCPINVCHSCLIRVARAPPCADHFCLYNNWHVNILHRVADRVRSVCRRVRGGSSVCRFMAAALPNQSLRYWSWRDS